MSRTPVFCKTVNSKGLGLVFGWAIVCTKNGKPSVDEDDHHIPDDVMLEGAMEFMLSSRELQAMHNGRPIGKVVCAWPLTAEVAKSMGVVSDQTGLMIAVKPTSSDVLAKFKSGEYPAFSIGGEGEFEEKDE